jgi:ATP-binding cassette subfamily C protein
MFGQVFYRPFPDGPVPAKGMLKFGIRGLGRDVWILVIMGAALGMLGALTPIITGKLFDTAIPQADRGALAQYTTALFAAALVTAAFKLTQSISTIRIQGKMDYSIQAGLWDRLLNLPSDFFRDYTSGDLADRASGINAIRGLVAGAGISSILGSMSSVFYVILMFYYSLHLAVLAIGLTAVFVGFSAFANLAQLRYQREQLSLRGRITGLVLQFISGVGKLRVAGAENHAFRVWAGQFSKQRRIQFKIGRIQNNVAVFNSGFPIFSSMAIFWVLMMVQKAAEEQGGAPPMTTGDFIAFNTAYATFLAAMTALSDASLNLLRVIPLFERLKPIITAEAEIDESKTYPGKLKGEIELAHVSFRYLEDGPWIIDDMTLKLAPGEYVAFVGSSGCGKSTLMRLMLGFETPDRGSVYYDGQDLASLDLREVRQQLGVVLQSSSLLPADIYRNIIGTADLTLEDAWEAAKQAGIAEDISELPMGMHTYVAEGGGGFSGGQQQRLLIARAIVRKPRIIFLDEATSALDNRSQGVVTESMDRLQATRIVIAHRLSTIINADRICYLDAGKIIEMGSFDELMKLEGRFYELAKRQMA